jgi:hypothetical protein
MVVNDDYLKLWKESVVDYFTYRINGKNKMDSLMTSNYNNQPIHYISD